MAMNDTPAGSASGPLPSAILETCLSVSDLDRAREFYTGLFGYPVMKADHRFCALNIGSRQILLLFLKGTDLQGTHLPFGTIPPHGASGSSHVGFAVPADSLGRWQAALQQRRIAIESCFQWPAGGTSVYFRDPDGHLLELLTPGVWPIY